MRYSFVLLLCTGMAVNAQATDWTVDTLIDGADATPGDGTCATAQGQCSLRAAVQEANMQAGRDRVLLGTGRYALTIEDIDITEGIDIIGAGMTQTTIDATAANDRAFHIPNDLGDDATVLMSQLEITGGNAEGDGGAVRNQASLILENVRMASNQATLDGGAISNEDSATVTIRNVEFVGNSAGSSGGAISNTARRFVDTRGRFAKGAPMIPLEDQGVVRINDSTFLQNVAQGGGAVDNASSGAIYITASDFFENSASSFDGGAVNNNNSNSLVDITSSVFRDNTAVRDGGATNNNSSGALVVRDSEASGNSAGRDGGAFNATGSRGAIEILRTSVTGNEAVRDGGGVHSFSDARIEGSTLSDNNAQRDGGGFKAGGDRSVLINNTITLNSAAEEGGGVFASSCSVVGIKNTIVTNNNGGGDCLVQPAFSIPAGELLVSLGHNIDTDGSCQLSQPSDFAMTDPLLETLADNGAPGLSQVPMESSVAIDNGDPQSCSTFDQRGIARSQPALSDAAVCDIGSAERATAPPEVVFASNFESYSPELVIPQPCLDD